MNKVLLEVKMKATGIIRKIDELGRVVIPKEIRRSISLREGDNLEILVENDFILLKKYQPMGKLNYLARTYAKTLSDMTGFSVCISNTEKIIAVSGAKKEKYEEENISKNVLEVMKERIIWSTMDESIIPILHSEKYSEHLAQVIAPIICNAEVVGTVILFSEEKRKKITDLEFKLVQLTANYLGSQLE